MVNADCLSFCCCKSAGAGTAATVRPARKAFIYAQLIEIVDVAKANLRLLDFLSVG